MANKPDLVALLALLDKNIVPHWTLDTVKDAITEIERLRVDLAKFQESEFHPDWSMLAATRRSLREQCLEIKEGDYWMKRSIEFQELGGCPVCFATDEAGHNPGCLWGSDEAEIERLRDTLRRLLAALPHETHDSTVGWCAGCGAVHWCGDHKGFDPCKPDCVLQSVSNVARNE